MAVVSGYSFLLFTLVIVLRFGSVLHLRKVS
jgi:hypothetical protein